MTPNEIETIRLLFGESLIRVLISGSVMVLPWLIYAKRLSDMTALLEKLQFEFEALHNQLLAKISSRTK